MEAKLIKTIDEQGVMYSLSGKDLPENYVLSLKNCQAIELGYDLDELSKKIRGLMMVSGTSNGTIDHPNTDKMISLFQKALEILGDKKFSEDDMINFAEYCKGDLMKTKDLFNEYQSLQQNEWKVEIVEEDSKVVESHIWDGSNDGELTWKKQPLFDVDGNLILKRK
jgi:hypothetical protein